jgi:chromosome segregation ATPase
MPYPRRRTRLSEVQLKREVDALQMTLVRVREQLRNKESYASGLEVLVHERSERVDELSAKLEQSRAQIRHLDQECEHLADMIRIMPQLDAMISLK